MAGGFLGLLGVWVGWYARDVASPHGGFVHVVARGTADLTGAGAVATAIVVFLAGIVMLVAPETAASRWSATVAATCGLLLVTCSIVGVLRAGAVTIAGTAAARPAFGAAVSIVAGGVAAASGVVARRRTRTPTAPSDANASRVA